VDRWGAAGTVAYREMVNFVVAVNNFGDTRAGGLAGPMGLFIIVLMCVATVLLIRNMNKRLRRLPDSFQDTETQRRQAEVARLAADGEASAGGTDRPEVDGDRSDSPGDRAESEVNDVATAADPQVGRPKTDRG
jgi:hypothetical protein